MRLPKIPKSMLRPPKGFKVPNVEDFKADMQRLGEEIAEEFKERVTENIEENTYGFTIDPQTAQRKGNNLPLVDTHEMVDSIYREGTTVSVEDTPHKDSPLTNKELAIVHEYGAPDVGIPARPVWRNTFRDYREDAEKQVRSFLKTKKFKRK